LNLLQGIKECSIIFLLIAFCLVQLNAQTRESLEKERMSIIEQIDNTSRILNKTKKNQKVTIKDLDLLQTQIKNRKLIIENITFSLEISSSELEKGKEEKSHLEKQYIQLRKNYEDLIRMNHRQVLSENKLVYLLSSETWDESLLRWRYSHQLKEHLKKKIESLHLTENELAGAIEIIEQQKLEQKKLLEEEEQNILALEQDEKSKDKILYKLQGDEKRLRGALIQQRKEREGLNKMIEKIILESLKEKRAERKVETDLVNRENEVKLNKKFKDNKRRLPWPMAKGTIVSPYGKQRHSSLENVFVQNNGIDILSNNNAKVTAIFEGEVVGKMKIPGNDNMIIIKHGEFYTVYSKLREVFVTKGDKVSKGFILGKLGENNTTLHFEIWQNKEKVDPAKWLKPY